MTQTLSSYGGTVSIPDTSAGQSIGSEFSRYWEQRASRFATNGAGLAAVCSYGMPWFYNRYIDFTQWRALRRWLRVRPGTTVLDVGCGIGRWSRKLAHSRALVTGVDIAPTMIAEAKRRAAEEGISARCRFLRANLADLALGETYERILSVTVLQHVLDPDEFQAAVNKLACHLAPGGTMIILEAAPSRAMPRCDSNVFIAREAGIYRAAFAQADLRCLAEFGVDPAPFKTRFLPHYSRWPRWLAVPALGAVVALSLPLDLFAGERVAGISWHRLFVLKHAETT